MPFLAMKKFKYQMMRIYGVDPSKHERALNETGEDGWELVSVLLRKDDVGGEYAVYYLKKSLVVRSRAFRSASCTYEAARTASSSSQRA